MDEGKEHTNREQAGAEEPSKGKHPGKRNPTILILGITIAILIVALIITATPLKGILFASKTSPELALELVSGPVLEESGKYRFEVAAKVSGNPSPDVIFNRDDSLGEAGENRVVIFLDPAKSFTLKVLAKNSQGSGEASMELTAGTDTAGNGEEGDAAEEDEEVVEGEPTEETEEEPVEEAEEVEPPANRNPVISGITIPSGLLFHGESYSIRAQANDPDGDSLTYRWEVSAPGLPTITATGNPMTLRTDESKEMNRVTVKVRVRDGQGGEAVRSQEVVINPVITLVPTQHESGHIRKDTMAGFGVLAGDTNANIMCRGFISFNATWAIPGSFTVHKAVLRLSNPFVNGDPSVFHGSGLGLWVGMLYWGPRGLQRSDYNLSGTGIMNFTDYDITLTSIRGESNEKLVKEIENRLNSGTDRLQFRLHFVKDTSNGNNEHDYVAYQYPNIALKIYITLDG